MAVKYPPPQRLTKQQFAKKNPSGIYQNYLNAYTRQFGGPPNTARGRPNQPFAGPTYESLLRGINIETPAQLEARANRMAQIGIVAQQKIIREEAARLRGEAKLRADSIAAAGRAAAQMNAGLFGMVGGEYNAAAGEIRGLGTNLANQMYQTQAGQQLATNAGLENIGAPNMLVGGPAGANTIAGAPQAAVAAYQGGELPGQAISTAGEAAQFGLAGMVAAQNLRATQEANAGFITDTRKADADRMTAIKELAAGRPAAALQFLQQLQASQQSQRELAMSLLAARQTFGLQNQGNKRATATARQDRATAILNRQLARQQAAQTGRAIDPDKSFAMGIYVDKMGRPILDPKTGKPIPWKKPPPTSDSTSAAANPDNWAANRYDVERSAKDFVYNSTKNGEKVTAQQLLRYLKAIYPRALWPKIAAAVNALPKTFFQGTVNSDAATSIWKKGSGKAGSGDRAK